MPQTLLGYCTERGQDATLRSFDAEKNAPLTPDGVSYGSRKKLWWRCDAGHSWQAAVYTRTAGSGCPVCAGRRVIPGENDLASRRPDVAAQWHFGKNAPLAPEDVTPDSHKRVWWLCPRGHEWQAAVKTRAEGRGCPVCANRAVVPGVNDLATTAGALAREWDFAKNAPLTPQDVTSGSSKSVWWLCPQGHGWRAAVASRARGTDCPVCAGKRVIAEDNDLASRFPQIAAQWHPTKNGALSPSGCTGASNRRVWWLCPEGHEYQAAIGARTVSGSGCPYCAGRKVWAGFNDLASVEPRVAAQWHPSMNGSLTPEDVTAGSARKVWWKCSSGHVWQAVISSRTGPKKCGCPVCAGTVRRPRHAARVPYPGVQYSAMND